MRMKVLSAGAAVALAMMGSQANATIVLGGAGLIAQSTYYPAIYQGNYYGLSQPSSVSWSYDDATDLFKTFTIAFSYNPPYQDFSSAVNTFLAQQGSCDLTCFSNALSGSKWYFSNGGGGGSISFSLGGNIQKSLSLSPSIGNPPVSYGSFGVMTNIVAPAPAVPEPATWAMLLTGFAAIGYTMRKRRQTISVSFA